MEEVEVTATRLRTGGFAAPTPTTTIGAAEIANLGEPDIFVTVTDLPALAGNTGMDVGTSDLSSGAAGLSSPNIHGLGINRTLVLLDGERVASAFLTGIADISQFPQGLIERVEIVTGGASASWGSDAVSGVVNFILDHDFTGFKADAQGFGTNYGDGEGGLLRLTAGLPFAGDRGHLVATGEIYSNNGVPYVSKTGRNWYRGTKIVERTIANTPPGEPQYLVRDYAVNHNAARGGLITTGPLAGTAFGPGGVPYQYQYGEVIGSYMIGGGSNSESEVGTTHSPLAFAQDRRNLYLRGQYELTPSVSLFGTALYSRVFTEGVGSWEQYRLGNLTISCENPFLPESVRTACDTNSITNFRFGTYNWDISIATGGLDVETDRTLLRFTTGLDGVFDAFDSEWKWNLYVEHGENESTVADRDVIITPYYNAAIDVVLDPVTGRAICRSEVARSLGCVPLNLFGKDVASLDAIEWVLGDPTLDTQVKQVSAGLSIAGDAFSLWAGRVAVALGANYREESFTQQADCISYSNCPTPENPAGNPLLSNTTSNYYAGNFQPSSGKYHIAEAFLELGIPLADNDRFGSAELTLAGRHANYSTAGDQSTWKVGLNYSPGFVPGLRLRALQSRDIRAPNLAELFAAPRFPVAAIVDRFPPFEGEQYQIISGTVGNPNLDVEKATNTQFGLVLQPDWFPGFSASVDFYRIELEDGIASVGGQELLDLCFQGETALCNNITRDSTGRITQIVGFTYNISSLETEGVDIELAYRRNIGNGQLTLRLLGTHVAEYLTNSGLPGAIPQNLAGQHSGRAGFGGVGTGAIPDWKWTGTQTFATENFSITLTERWISDGVIDNAYIECTSNCPAPTINNPTIDNNKVEGAFYVDLSGSYRVTDDSEIYFKVANVTDVDPPRVPSRTFYTNATAVGGLYDLLGRVYSLGYRVQF